VTPSRDLQRLRRRKRQETIFRVLMAAAMLVVIGCLVLIVGTIIWKIRRR
jgi:uncharacterized membrane protein